MDRKVLREYTHKADNFLTTDSTAYKQWIFRYTFLELEKDLGTKGDITTDAIFHDRRKVSAEIVAKGNGIVAGMAEIQYFLCEADRNFLPRLNEKFDVEMEVGDGTRVSEGDILMRISGDVRDVLAVERVVLNLLMRMSGVATFTARLVEKVADFDVLLVPTRKTLWGRLDKRAVCVGGGGTHRLNLSDSILIKDSHLDLFDRDLEKIFLKMEGVSRNIRFIEVEAVSKDEALKFSGLLHNFIKGKDLSSIGVILMDNMEPDEVVAAMKDLKKEEVYEELLFEVSGGINEENLVEFAGTGVDIVSMGCLTNQGRSLDLSLRMAGNFS